MQTQVRNSQETIVQPWGRVLVPPQRIHITIPLSCFADTETPTKWEKLTVCCPQAHRPQTWLEPEGWWCWPPLTSPPTNQKNVHELITPSSLKYYCKTHYSLQDGTKSFEGISPSWPPLPGKAIKLFFSTSPKTLSLSLTWCQGTEARFGFRTDNTWWWRAIGWWKRGTNAVSMLKNWVKDREFYCEKIRLGEKNQDLHFDFIKF